MGKSELIAQAHFVAEVVSWLGFILFLLACFSGIAGAWLLCTISIVLLSLALVAEIILSAYYRYLLRRLDSCDHKSGLAAFLYLLLLDLTTII